MNEKQTKQINVQVIITTGSRDKPDSKVFGESETIAIKGSTRRAAARCMKAILTEMWLDGLRIIVVLLLVLLCGCAGDPWSDNIGPKNRPVDPFGVGVTNKTTL